VRGSFETGSGICQDQLSQLDSAQSQHAVGNRLNVFASTLHDDDFQAVMAIKMDMRGREDHGACVVLNFSQLLREIGNVMVVNKRQSADHRLVRFNDLRQKRLTYKIAEGLGAIRITALGNEPIEFLQQIIFEGNASSAQL
jgi:hypothetical protein